MTAAWHLEHPERSQHPCASGWAASLAWHSSSLGGWAASNAVERPPHSQPSEPVLSTARGTSHRHLVLSAAAASAASNPATQAAPRCASTGQPGSLYDCPPLQGSKSFFSEIISSISNIKFSRDGRYILSRDYMNLKLWDINMEAAPVAVYPVHEQLRARVSHGPCRAHQAGQRACL